VTLLFLGWILAGAAGATGTSAQPLASELNQARVRYGLAPLSSRADLDAIARRHSEAMAAKAGPEFHSTDLGSQVEGWARLGEVVGRTSWPDSNWARTMTDAFLASPSHRADLLNEDFTQMGVGAAISPNGGVLYVTAVFVQPATASAAPAPQIVAEPSAGRCCARVSPAPAPAPLLAPPVSRPLAVLPEAPSPSAVASGPTPGRASAGGSGDGSPIGRGLSPVIAVVLGLLLIAAVAPARPD
jgi:hypothetical protein